MTPLSNNSSLARLRVRRHSSPVNRSLKGWGTCTDNRHDRYILAIRRHGYQWLVLFIAWLGWVFDAMDATIYAIVLHSALHDLLQSSGGTVSSEQVG